MSPQRKLRQCLHSAPSGACLRHSAWLSAAFERTLSIAISRHHDILLLIRRHSALVDILNSSLRHPRRPSHPSSQPIRRGLLLTRPPSGCLIFRLSRFNSLAAQRRITDVHTSEIARRKKIYSRKWTQHFNIIASRLI